MPCSELNTADIIDIAIAAQPLLNSLLINDVLDNGYVC